MFGTQNMRKRANFENNESLNETLMLTHHSSAGKNCANDRFSSSTCFQNHTHKMIDGFAMFESSDFKIKDQTRRTYIEELEKQPPVSNFTPVVARPSSGCATAVARPQKSCAKAVARPPKKKAILVIRRK